MIESWYAHQGSFLMLSWLQARAHIHLGNNSRPQTASVLLLHSIFRRKVALSICNTRPSANVYHTAWVREDAGHNVNTLRLSQPTFIQEDLHDWEHVPSHEGWNGCSVNILRAPSLYIGRTIWICTVVMRASAQRVPEDMGVLALTPRAFQSLGRC